MKQLHLAILLILGSVTGLRAQDREVELLAESVITPQFFIAVIAGVLLALGFQFILTALSVALGITAIGDLKKSYVESKNHSSGKDTFKDDDEDDADGMSTGTMITTGFGIWSVITVGLSLFGATALAINLSLITSGIISVTLGLVIWATFFILMFYLESKAVNSLIGGLIHTATAGLRASGEAVKKMFSTSSETQMKHVAEDTVDKITHDLQASFDPHAVNDTLDEFFKRFDNKVPDYGQLKKDIEDIVEKSNQDITINEDSGGGQGKWMAAQSVINNAISESGDSNDEGKKGKVEQLKKLQKEFKSAYKEGNTDEEKIEKVVSKFTSAEEEEVQGYIKKIKEVLSKVKSDDTKGANLKEQIMPIIQNPKVEGNKLAQRISELDRETIISLLSENTQLKKEQIENYTDKAEEAIQSVQKKLSQSGDGNYRGEHPHGQMSDLKEKLEIAVFQFMNHTGKPDINLSMLTSFVQGKLNSSSGGGNLSQMKKRLKNFDKDSLRAVVTNNTNIDQKDIDKVVQSIEDARDNVLNKIDELEDEARKRVENTKRKAVIQAEHTRKTAASAAWWLVISAILSAGAAIGGSLLAMA
ncbi:hypothetical protein RM549_05280 [Salegentibacter sp. F188]|uniref:Uncharacterized protein n=1 Tax=Autumnicola patrickiae TaxID=3075591 RepID=A0ABU3DZN4_9FLAO|nr:hypothetical protein [Salegentibacter sp. F188]MDT0689186.1 hypothetical protein [Salegentibacter sp. F188]